MDLASATDLAFTAVRRSRDSARGSNRSVQVKNPGGAPLLTDYRLSGIHKTLHTSSIGVYDRWIVTLSEGAPGKIRLRMRDIETRRHQELAVEVSTEAEIASTIEAWYEGIEWWRNRLSIYRLGPGTRYRVIQSFEDYRRRTFEAGTVLTFVERHFLPYEGGHTIIFKEANLYLQETESSPIIEDFDAYVAEMS